MTFFGNFDIAQLCLYAFWAFFFGLIVYLQRETMREGYPLESEVSGKPEMMGLFGNPPAPKTFRLPHGRGVVSLPDPQKDAREITDRPFAMRATAAWSGAPFEPTGDPMVDGIGPAAWAERADLPELTLEGEPKIVPLRAARDWDIAAGDRDIRGWPVLGCDGAAAGTVKDVWVDRAESLIRYLEVAPEGGTPVLCPMTCAVVSIAEKVVKVDSITAAQFARVPGTRKRTSITSLEEERVMAYFAGGKLYATRDRQEPLL